MTQDYAADAERALRTLQLAVRVLQVTTAVTLAAALYGIWRWHRSRWK